MGTAEFIGLIVAIILRFKDMISYDTLVIAIMLFSICIAIRYGKH